MGKLDGRVAVITGAGSGQGAAAARLFASEGAAVVVAEYNADTGQEVTDELTKSGGRAASRLGQLVGDFLPGVGVVLRDHDRGALAREQAGRCRALPAASPGDYCHAPVQLAHCCVLPDSN